MLLYFLVLRPNHPLNPSENIRLRRQVHCHHCPLYNKSRRTCGTPGRTYVDHHGNLLRLGCWCLLPLKNRIPSNCWLSNASHGSKGWPINLNSYPLANV